LEIIVVFIENSGFLNSFKDRPRHDRIEKRQDKVHPAHRMGDDANGFHLHGRCGRDT
jgi:hypothetical protein